MKISSISKNSVKCVKNHNSNNANNANTNADNTSINNARNQSFNGLSDALVAFWQTVDNGGRALQFTVEDMCGTNLPRTYKGAMAGYKYTKKINVLALAQEALREFLTGPTMCIMPVAILGIAKKAAGPTSDTHIENIKNLSYLMGKTNFTSNENFDKDFITTVIEDTLKQSTGKDTISRENVENLTSAILNYKNMQGTKKEKKAALDAIISMFKGIIKQNKDSYANTDFSVAKYTVADGKQGATSFKNYVNYTINYAKDFSKKHLSKDSIENVTSETINNFRNLWLGKRAVVIAAMIGITGLAMSFIPKIYTFFSGNVNPNAKEVYKEADKDKTAENKKDKSKTEGNK